MTKYYKVLKEDGSAFHGGVGTWLLPVGDEPGEWMEPVQGKLVPCKNGYHLCRREDLLYWLGPAVWEAEVDGELVEAKNKVVCRRARLLCRIERWNERTARLFACDCAERALPCYEQQYPEDKRPREAIEVARRYAKGEATAEELSATRSVAKSAAESAAWDAAWDAAWSAACDAACDAAESAAKSAAESAAESVAESAADSAAWGAAWDAARSAAWSAAWSAERAWQTERLFAYLEGEVS